VDDRDRQRLQCKCDDAAESQGDSRRNSGANFILTGHPGLRLFTAKGCVGCHRHLEVNPEHKTDTKFDLTGRRFQQDYLKKFLADPSIKPAEMPNLNLKQDEIEALAAFINKAVVKQQPR